MSREQNKSIVRRLVEEGFNRGNTTIADELMDADYVGHGPAGESGRDQWKQAVVQLRTTFPDYHLTVEDIVAEADRVVWRWTMHGTDLGGFADRPPTGRQATMWGINIERLADGKIVESWSSSDHSPLLRQLGVLATPD